MKLHFAFIPFLLVLGCTSENLPYKETRWDDAQFEDYVNSIDSTCFQSAFKDNLGTQKALDDFLLFRYVLENCQTSIYRFSTKNKVDSMFEVEFNNLKKTSSYFEILRSISRVQNTIACGHSGWSHLDGFYD